MIPLLLAMGCPLAEAVGTSAASSLPLVLVAAELCCAGFIDWVAFWDWRGGIVVRFC